jgi:hypothetical protein
MPSRYDYCKGVRKTYAAAIRLISNNMPLTHILTAIPAAYLTAFTIFFYSDSDRRRSTTADPFFGGTISLCVALTLLWSWAALCIWKTAPNALSVAIYLNRAIGNWTTISFLLLLFYGISVLPGGYTAYLFVTLTPLILTLHLTADIQRGVRDRLFAALEPPSPPPEPTGAPKIVIHE